ncbi:hypothetical protein EMPS_03269 [Entomortierella parvispora]|uniref:Signal peptide peptidase n=1 Tax=Entomortierella parvispora TaxID=205924 RepID=A0A9P3H682_9FUNG|nr:hypothetical protein EMPS_03269 [Entomortierella parvispora]
MSVMGTLSIYLPHLLSAPLLPLALLATTVLTLSTLAAADTTVEDRHEQRQKEESGEAVALTKLHALGFIVMASLGLLAMWMWANVLVYLSLFCFGLSAFVSIQQCLPDILHSFGMRQGKPWQHNTVAGLFVLTWFWLRNTSCAWIFQDIMGGFTITLMLRVLKASSMSTPAYLLLAAFVYDVFFVFVTPYLTRSGESIMEAAATGATMTVKETIPMLFRVPSFKGDGEAILGFGDVVLPGILVTFLKECDARLEEDQPLSLIGGLSPAQAAMAVPHGLKNEQKARWWNGKGRWGYHLTAILGFFVGLQMTYIGMMWSRKGQPALLYLVPSTLLPVIILASRRHELSLLWNGWGDLDSAMEEDDQEDENGEDYDRDRRLDVSDLESKSHGQAESFDI